MKKHLKNFSGWYGKAAEYKSGKTNSIKKYKWTIVDRRQREKWNQSIMYLFYSSNMIMENLQILLLKLQLKICF